MKSVFSHQELDDLMGDPDISTPAGIGLRDGRQVQVLGIFSRGNGQAAQGRAGVQTIAASLRFPEHQCEDVATDDLVQVEGVNYKVREATTDSVGITTLKLRRES